MMASRLVSGRTARLVWAAAGLALTLLLGACSSNQPLTVGQIQQTREAAATAAVVNQDNAAATRQAVVAARGPEGTVVDPVPPGREHANTLSGQFGPLPPNGGMHHPVWQTCGIYDAPIHKEHAVHSLEHGAVWVTYQPELAADQLTRLRREVQGQTFVLMSPFPGQRSPIVMTAWGVQLELERADDPRLGRFFAAYVRGPQTPEPGASCSGGSTETLPSAN